MLCSAYLHTCEDPLRNFVLEDGPYVVIVGM